MSGIRRSSADASHSTADRPAGKKITRGTHAPGNSNTKDATMKTKTHPWPGGKSYHETFASLAAKAIAAAEVAADRRFAGQSSPAFGNAKRGLATAHASIRSTCCALVTDGTAYPRECGMS